MVSDTPSSPLPCLIGAETRKIEIELREDSLDLAKDHDMPSTAPERYKRARSSVTDRRTVVREFLEVGNAHTYVHHTCS